MWSASFLKTHPRDLPVMVLPYPSKILHGHYDTLCLLAFNSYTRREHENLQTVLEENGVHVDILEDLIVNGAESSAVASISLSWKTMDASLQGYLNVPVNTDCFHLQVCS